MHSSLEGLFCGNFVLIGLEIWLKSVVCINADIGLVLGGCLRQLYWSCTFDTLLCSLSWLSLTNLGLVAAGLPLYDMAIIKFRLRELSHGH